MKHESAHLPNKGLFHILLLQCHFHGYISVNMSIANDPRAGSVFQ